MTRHCSVGKQFRFEAAHQIPNHFGKCRNLHGHSYKVEVQFYGEIKEGTTDSDDGMVEDFYNIGQVVKPLIERVDHTFLNESLAADLKSLPTTAENIAWWFFEQISGQIAGLEAVTVWETENCYAQVTDEDMMAMMGGHLG